MAEDEKYDEYREKIKAVLAKAKEPYAQRRSDLGGAYRLIQRVKDDYDLGNQLYWVMYYLLVDELDREQKPEQNGAGSLANLQRILTQCNRMGILGWGNPLFLMNVQRRLVSHAWQLSKDGQVAQLCQFMATISPLVDPMFDVDYDRIDSDSVYNDPRSGEIGMAGATSSLVAAVTVAMRKISPLPMKDIATLAGTPGTLASQVVQGISVQVLVPAAWQLEKADDSAGLRNLLRSFQPILGSLHAPFAKTFLPFYLGLYRHHPEQLEQNRAALTSLLAALCIENLTAVDYRQQKQADGKTYPSVADNVADLYLALGRTADIPTTDQFDHLVEERVFREVIGQEWNAAKQNNPQQLATIFEDTRAQFTNGDFGMQTGKMILPYYLTLYKHQQGDRGQYASLWEQVVEFFGLDHFTTDELREKENTAEDGHPMPSLAEEVISAYVKSLLLTGARDDQVTLAQHGLEVLDQPTTSRDWIVYQLGKVLAQRGQLAQLNDELLAAVKRNQRNTYFWSMLAARYRGDDPDKYQAALAMAVSLPNARLADIADMITILAPQDDQHALVKGLVALAKTTAKGKELPPVVQQVETQDWYQTTTASDDVATALQDLAKPIVGDVLYGDVEPMSFFVCWNNPQRNSTGIVPVKAVGHLEDPTRLHDQVLAQQVTTGGFYQARIVENGKHHDYYGHLKSYEPDEAVRSRYMMQFKGERLDRNEKHGFGFLHFLHSDCFVPDNLISDHHLHNSDLLSGTAWINWDSKKEEWGWQLGELTNVEPATEEQITGTFAYQPVSGDRVLGFVVLPDGQRALVPEEFLKASEFDDNEDVVATVAQHWNKKRRKWDLRVTKIAPADI